MSGTSDTVRRRLDELLGPATVKLTPIGTAHRTPIDDARPRAEADATSCKETERALLGDGPGALSRAKRQPGAEDAAQRDGAEPLPPRKAAVGPSRLAAAQQAARVWALAREHVVAIAVVVLCGCAWTAFQLMEAKPMPVQPALASPATSVAQKASATPTPSTSLQVHVIGAVLKPGVVQVPQGARVHHAIAAAGGAARDAKLGDLNLAAPLSDGQQIVVGGASGVASEVRAAGGGPVASGAGGVPAGAAAAGGAVPGSKVNLNTATLTNLDALPGVGPVTAQAILAWREQHGRFSRVEELQEIDGIGPKTFEKLAPLVTV